MSRSCCDEDDRTFYWEIDEEFLFNRDADVHGHTLFHDSWHIVQFLRDGGFAMQQHVQVAREVEAINHQIKVAQLLGCDDREITFLAGRSFRAYRESGGTRSRILSDFIIGAHAQERAGRLLSRDRGFYRAYFKKLQLLDPGTA